MRISNIALFSLISAAVAQNASDALALVSKFNGELQSSSPGEITLKLTSLAAQIQSLGPSLPCDPSMKSQIAVQAAGIVSRVAIQGMSVGPDALGGDAQSALKGFLEGVVGCIEGVDKEIGRMLPINTQVFLKNNAGSAMAVLSQADSKPLVDIQVGNGAVNANTGVRVNVRAEL